MAYLIANLFIPYSLICYTKSQNMIQIPANISLTKLDNNLRKP